MSRRVSMSAIATMLAARAGTTTRSLGAAPVRRDARQVADDEAGGVDAARLDVLGVDADVADVRIGERDDLPGVRRIGEDLLVAGHRGVEHDLADRRAGGADRAAAKHRAVGERERGRHVRRKQGGQRGGREIRGVHGGPVAASAGARRGRFAGCGRANGEGFPFPASPTRILPQRGRRRHRAAAAAGQYAARNRRRPAGCGRSRSRRRATRGTRRRRRSPAASPSGRPACGARPTPRTRASATSGAFISVSKKPGAMPLTCTLNGASSTASARVSIFTAPLLVAYGTMFGRPRSLASEQMLMILPLRRAFMPGSTRARDEERAVEVGRLQRAPLRRA